MKQSLLIFLIFFVPLFIKIPLVAIPGATTPLRVDDLVFAVIIFLFFLGLCIKKIKLQRTPLDFPIIIYLCTGLISTLIGIMTDRVSLYVGILYFGRIVQFILLYYMVYSLIVIDKLNLYLKYFWIVLGIVILLFPISRIIPLPVSESEDDFSIGGFQGFSTFTVSYDLGAYFLLMGLILFSITLLTHQNKHRLLLLGCIISLFFAQARISIAAFFVSLLMSIFFIKNKLRYVLLMLTLFLVAFVTFISVPLPQKVTQMLTLTDLTVLMQDPSLAIRIANAQSALENFFNGNIFFGGGHGSFLTFSSAYGLPATLDSWYIRLLSDTGLIGFISFFILIGAILKKELVCCKRTSNKIERAYLTGFILGTIGLLINALFVDVFVAIKIGMYFWIFTAIAMKIYSQRILASFHKKS